MDTLPERVFEKILFEPNTGCWLWTAYRRPRGYGMVRHNGRVAQAHRVVYEHFFGPIPIGLEPDHLCRVRRCVSPYHMELVPHIVNIRRGNLGKAGREATHCQRGHEFSMGNTIVATRATGSRKRSCRACYNAAKRRRRSRS